MDHRLNTAILDANLNLEAVHHLPARVQAADYQSAMMGHAVRKEDTHAKDQKAATAAHNIITVAGVQTTAALDVRARLESTRLRL